MNCDLFELVADDLLCDQPVEAGTCLRALRHAESCPACAQRLADLRSLRQELRALAGSMASLEAPPRIEAALLAQFRNQHQRDRWSARRSGLVRAGFAAAAAVLLVIGATTLLRHGDHAVRPSSVAQVAVPAAPAEPPQTPSLATATSPHSVASPVRRVRKVVHHSPLPAASQAESAMEFLPLPYSYDAMPLGDAQVVRVRIPRSALALAGFPVRLGTDGQAGGYVLADVLLSEDGLARGISFVQ